jgi:selenocysteine lyase/cysteine desulfurase
MGFLKSWSLKALFDQNLAWHGHFLTFEAPSVEVAEKCHQTLADQHILIDRRGNRLRFGFGLYQDQDDVAELLARLNKLA